MIDEQITAVPVQTQPPPSTFSISQAIEERLSLVQKIARAAYHRYGRNYEHDDLVGYGHLGLVNGVRKYATLKYDIRQAVDFSKFVERRIWRAIEVGRDQMSHVGRWQWRRMKKGEIRSVKTVMDSQVYTMADAIDAVSDGLGELSEEHDVDSMLEWLRTQRPLWAQVVDLRMKGLNNVQVGELIGKTRGQTSSLYARGVRMLQWKYNVAGYRHDDRTARRHRAKARVDGRSQK